MAKKQTPAEAAASFMKDLKDKAEKLYSVRRELNTREEAYKLQTDHLFQEEAKLKAEILEGMNAIGTKSIKVDSGDSFYVSKSHGVEITNERAAIEWATAHRLVNVDKTLMKAKLKSMAEKGEQLPEGFKLYERDTISVRKAKPAGEGETPAATE